MSDEEIRSGLIIDDGLELPHIRSGTQYFEIHGSRRIARALGEEDPLPTELARGLEPEPEPARTPTTASMPESMSESGPESEPDPVPGAMPEPMPEPMIDLPSGPGLPDEGGAWPVEQAAAW